MRLKRPKNSPGPQGTSLSAFAASCEVDRIVLPTADNASGALRTLQRANELYRQIAWPEPYRTTSHRVVRGDARDLVGIPDASVHLVVTSPPYWTLKKYNSHPQQLGHIGDYEQFLLELEKVWRECFR